jgi:hypothetical protein
MDDAAIKNLFAGQRFLCQIHGNFLLSLGFLLVYHDLAGNSIANFIGSEKSIWFVNAKIFRKLPL